jgi:hypothetical protein
VPGRVCPFDSRRNDGRTRHGHGVQPRKEGRKISNRGRSVPNVRVLYLHTRVLIV